VSAVPIDDAQKTQLTTNVANIVRHSHVKVDAQRFGMAFRAIIEDLEPGQAIELDPIFHYFQQEMGVGEKEALELCIIIASRQDKLGVPITLPVKAQQLTTDALETIVGQAKAKAPITGSWGKTEPEKPLPGKKTVADPPVWAPDKKKRNAGPKMSSQRKLLILLGVCVFGAVGFHSWLAGTRENPIVEMQIPSGLPCTTIITSGKGVAICSLPNAVYTSTPPETLQAKGLMTKGALKAQGVKDLWVKIAETGRIKAVF
jgi:hypothetical protein